mgnify:CR=1 FL=1
MSLGFLKAVSMTGALTACAADDLQGTSGLMVNYPTPLRISNLGLEEDISGD